MIKKVWFWKGEGQLREFNTSGVCNPELHYYVDRRELLELTLEQIRGKQLSSGEYLGRYFTLFAPRQTGKSTFIAALHRNLSQEDYLFLNISFEGMVDITAEEFPELLAFRFQQQLALNGISPPAAGPWKIVELPRFFHMMREITSKRLILAIDEFDGLGEEHLGKLLHVFREIYHGRENFYNLHSLILIGVRNLTEINLDHASPFNITETIHLRRFSKMEVYNLIGQYEKETGQQIACEVKEKIFLETGGQPGLVNELCKLLVEQFNPMGKGQSALTAIEEPVFDRMLSYYISAHISKNVSNMINKARRDEGKILRLFDTATKVHFMIDEPWQKDFYIHGIIDTEVGSGTDQRYVKFSCPIYQKKIYAYFKPKLNSEQKNYLLPGEDYRQYLLPDNRLDLRAVLGNYQRYVNRRGSKAFDFARLRQDGSRLEAVYHYSLDAYLAGLMERLGGYSFVEFPTGNGKVDIWIYINRFRYVVEIKNYVDETLLSRAKLQAVEYAQSEGLTEAYLVVFTEVHDKSVKEAEFSEEIEGILLQGFLVNVAF